MGGAGGYGSEDAPGNDPTRRTASVFAAAVLGAVALAVFAATAWGGSRITRLPSCANEHSALGSGEAAEVQFRASMLCLINGARADEHLPALKRSRELETVATHPVGEVRPHRVGSHGPSLSDIGKRDVAAGYHPAAYNEAFDFTSGGTPFAFSSAPWAPGRFRAPRCSIPASGTSASTRPRSCATGRRSAIRSPSSSACAPGSASPRRTRRRSRAAPTASSADRALRVQARASAAAPAAVRSRLKCSVPQGTSGRCTRSPRDRRWSPDPQPAGVGGLLDRRRPEIDCGPEDEEHSPAADDGSLPRRGGSRGRVGNPGGGQSVSPVGVPGYFAAALATDVPDPAVA